MDGKHDNENEPLPFQTLAAITAALLEPKNPKQDDAERGRDEEGRAEREADREYVEYRLRQFEAFERRARGQKKSP